jgi:predicted nuclease with TOPRIM domain
MRRVIVEDHKGFKHAYLVRDGDPDEMAEKGIPLEPPDIERLPWEEVKRDLHNALVTNGLFTWQDVQRAQTKISAITRTLLKRRVVLLYRLDDKEANSNG